MATLFDSLPTAYKQAFAAFYDDLVAQGLAIVPPASLPSAANPNALPFASITSVGIYEKSSGKLVRTLWNNQSKAAGLLPTPWDKKDDLGVALPGDASLYEVRTVLRKQTTGPVWKGIVGNTCPQALTESIPFTVDDSSGNVVASTVHLGFRPPNGLSIYPTDTKALLAGGYTEGPQSHSAYALNDIQKRISYQLPIPSANRLTQATRFIDQDATNAYHLGFDGYDADQHGDRYSVNFVYATARATGSRVNFSSGTNYTIQQGRENKGITYSAYKLAGRAGGMAVQKGGVLLAISLPDTNQIVFLNKGTLAVIATSTLFTRPGALWFDREDRLWVASVNPGNPNTTPVKIPVTGDVVPIGSPGYGTDFQFSMDKAFDGNANTYFASTVNDPNGQLGLYLGAQPWVPTRVRLQPSGGREADCQGWIQLSNTNFDDVTGRDWKTPLEINTPPASGIFTNYDFANTRTWKYVRVYNPGKGFKVQDMEVWGYLRTDTPVVASYTVTSGALLTPTGVTLTGVQEPTALCDDGLGNLYVREGGSKQALCRYSKANGGASTFSATVAEDVRFYFTDSYGTLLYGEETPSPLACAPDNSVWVGDTGNNRLLHLSATGAYVEKIMFLPATRSCVGDANNINRLLGDNLEFALDHSKELSPTNGSWKPLGNWSRAYNSRIHGYLREVSTLSNGRTYGIIGRDDFLGQPMRRQVELMAGFQIRETGRVLAHGTQVAANGDIYRYEYQVGQPTKVYKQALTGFDASGNPQYNTETPLADGPTPQDGDPNRSSLQRFPSGRTFVYDGLRAGSGGSLGYHLAGWMEGKSFFQFRTARTNAREYAGAYPQDGSFNSGNEAGNTVGPTAILRDKTANPLEWLLWVYAAEGYNNKQACYMQIVDAPTGLLLYTFGSDAITNPPQMTSVVLSAVFVRVDADRARVFVNEEGGRGLGCWELTGIATTRTLALPVSLSLAS